MTFIPPKAIIACAALSIMALASTANASSEFNKFPATQTNLENTGNQVIINTGAHQKKKRSGVKSPRIIRVEKPLPKTNPRNLSYVSDNGTSNLRDGFNKMPAHKNKSSKPMPIYICEGASKAR